MLVKISAFCSGVRYIFFALSVALSRGYNAAPGGRGQFHRPQWGPQLVDQVDRPAIALHEPQKPFGQRIALFSSIRT